MFDPTPAPFGDLTRRWTQLTDQDRDHHTGRLLATACTDACDGHVDRPGFDEGVCYRQLVVAGAAGDEVALGWLATSHRPLLITRGRVLLEQDPSEWGAVCLEAIHLTLVRIDLSVGRWLRRRVAHQLSRHVTRVVAGQLTRRRREHPTAPVVLQQASPTPCGPWSDPHPDLSLVLDQALAGLDAATRDGFLALANQQPIQTVADRHDLSPAAVRQRMSRARSQLQPQLTGYLRTVDR